MTQRVALLNWKNKNKDFDLSKIFEAFSDSWIVEGLDFQNWYITPWYAFVEVQRDGRKFCVLYENTEKLPIDSNWTKKIFIEINNNNIIDGSRNNIDWTWIWSIKTAPEFPIKNFLKIWRFENWNFISERNVLKNFRNLNSNNSLLVLDWNWKIPVANIPPMPIDINWFSEKNLEDDQYFPVYDSADRENKKISVRYITDRFNHIEEKQNFKNEVYHFEHQLWYHDSEYIFQHNFWKIPDIIHIFWTFNWIWAKNKQIWWAVWWRLTTKPHTWTLNSYYGDNSDLLSYKITEVTASHIKFYWRSRFSGGGNLTVNIGLMLIW